MSKIPGLDEPGPSSGHAKQRRHEARMTKYCFTKRKRMNMENNDHRMLTSTDSSSDSEHTSNAIRISEMMEDEYNSPDLYSDSSQCPTYHEQRKKVYRKLKRDTSRIKTENSIIADWKQRQYHAERDNYKNHLREAMMIPNQQHTNMVENAGVLMAIEEFGLQQRIEPLLRFYGLDTDSTNMSSISGSITSSDSDSSLSSSDTLHKTPSRKAREPSYVPALLAGSESEPRSLVVGANNSPNFEDFAVSAAINNKGLSL